MNGSAIHPEHQLLAVAPTKKWHIPHTERIMAMLMIIEEARVPTVYGNASSDEQQYVECIVGDRTHSLEYPNVQHASYKYYSNQLCE